MKHNLEISTQPRKHARLFGIAAIALAAFASSGAQATQPKDCRAVFADRIADPLPNARVYGSGSAFGLASNRPMSTLAFEHYDYIRGQRIGVGDVPNFRLEYTHRNSVVQGIFKEIQVYGNFTHHRTWSTKSHLWMDLESGNVWTRSLTWKGGWVRWTNVLCYPNSVPGLSAMVLTGNIPQPGGGGRVVSLRMEVGQR